MRGSVVVMEEEGELIDWANMVGQTVEYCCRRQKKGTVATRVWLGKEEGEEAETRSTSEMTSWTQAVKGRENSREHKVKVSEKMVQGKVTHWVPEQQAGVIQTEEGEVIVSR